MEIAAYLIKTRRGSGQHPQVVERLTFDAEVARRAQESGSMIEALVTMSEAHQQLLKAVKAQAEQSRLIQGSGS